MLKQWYIPQVRNIDISITENGQIVHHHEKTDQVPAYAYDNGLLDGTYDGHPIRRFVPVVGHRYYNCRS